MDMCAAASFAATLALLFTPVPGGASLVWSGFTVSSRSTAQLS
jgi:hypothetical protein